MLVDCSLNLLWHWGVWVSGASWMLAPLLRPNSGTAKRRALTPSAPRPHKKFELNGLESVYSAPRRWYIPARGESRHIAKPKSSRIVGGGFRCRRRGSGQTPTSRCTGSRAAFLERKAIWVFSKNVPRFTRARSPISPTGCSVGLLTLKCKFRQLSPRGGPPAPARRRDPRRACGRWRGETSHPECAPSRSSIVL